MSSVSCGHWFCNTCWRAYIATAIGNGPGCLSLRCPEPSCGVAVDQDMVGLFVSKKDKGRYSRHLLRSYVESNRSVQWCPGPGCELAVRFAAETAANFDVWCDCKNNFCWNCSEDAHRPVDCATVGKWMKKNMSEAENTTWILAYTKPCPNCRRNIEKDGGCNHMTCRLCNSQFCWMCLSTKWNHETCNAYAVTGTDEADKKRDMAKKRIEKYTHYFERWATNQRSREMAIESLKSMNLEELSHKQVVTVAQLKFVSDAWEQIVECRRVLKWTYAYGYYLAEEAEGKEKDDGKKKFFEYVQGEAEAGLERLHGCAEKELKVHAEGSNTSRQEFMKFQAKLMDLTAITKKFFENLVSALENGLCSLSAD